MGMQSREDNGALLSALHTIDPADPPDHVTARSSDRELITSPAAVAEEADPSMAIQIFEPFSRVPRRSARSRRPSSAVLATVARLAGPGGVRSVVAESVLVRQL